jgi:hypothetical protein
VVESQREVSTRKLVRSAAEHEVLEALLESAKPPLPEGPLDRLLTTPFRYPPLRHGSRFGTRAERGIFYASEHPEAALAERAYYALVFLEGTAADLPPLEVPLTVFEAAYRTARGVDLTARPFAGHADAISSPTAYAATQQLGREMRADGAEGARYRSARDPGGRANVALFTPAVFARRAPVAREEWHATASRDGVEFLQRFVPARRVVAFTRGQFEVKGKLPAPAV